MRGNSAQGMIENETVSNLTMRSCRDLWSSRLWPPVTFLVLYKAAFHRTILRRPGSRFATEGTFSWLDGAATPLLLC
ncbi:hypothetical protein VTO42DRAFT_4257 [Malbranchea cinnamomea]